MKLTTGVNFINILWQRFCTKANCAKFGFVPFLQKDIGKKIAHKMLMKLTSGLFGLTKRDDYF